MNPHEKVKHIVASAAEKKAREVVSLNLAGIATFCDYFVIVSGTSAPHIRAVADGIRESLKKIGLRPHHIEGHREAIWVVMDYGSVVVHIFEPSARQFYGLERLWQDAPRTDHAADGATERSPC